MSEKPIKIPSSGELISQFTQIDQLHQPTRSIRFGYPCTTCTECLAIYPCPTVRILQGDNQ